MKRFKRYTAFLLMLIMVFALGLTGCGEAAEEQEAYATEVETLVLASEKDGENASAEDNAAQQNADEQAAYATETETAGADQNNSNAAANNTAGADQDGSNAAANDTAAAAQNNSAAGETAAQDSGADLTDAAAETDAEGNPLLDEFGSYYQKDEVALYIHQYGKLPENYITKREAEDLGWSGGSVESYAPGRVIGGSKFGNYEGLLPKKKGRQYYECDIDTLKKKRGAKRIVFSNDGLIYYTEDHYESFELLYGEE